MTLAEFLTWLEDAEALVVTDITEAQTIFEFEYLSYATGPKVFELLEELEDSGCIIDLDKSQTEDFIPASLVVED